MMKYSPFHAINEYSARRSLVPLILHLGTRWRAVVKFKIRQLYPWKRTPVLTELEAGWVPEPFWAFYRRDISTVLPGIRTLNPKKY
jgi:hypothetical protein